MSKKKKAIFCEICGDPITTDEKCKVRVYGIKNNCLLAGRRTIVCDDCKKKMLLVVQTTL